MNDQPTERLAAIETTVHLLRRPPDDAIARLRQLVDSTVHLSIDPDPLLQDTSVLVAGRPSREHLASCPQLLTLIVPYAGVPKATLDLMKNEFSHVAIHNLHHNAVAAAELAIALLLAAAKTIVPVDRSFRDHDWRSRYDGAPMLLLAGKTVLLIGLGAIGLHVAAICRALGMRIVALRRRIDRGAPAWVDVRPICELSQCLPAADVVCVAAPLTSATSGLLGTRELALLPAHAVIVNVARGPIIDEQALYEALRDRRIGAAGIDTWYDYPHTETDRASTPPSSFPFHELDNVVMSPHRGGAFRTTEVEVLRMEHLAASINAASRGEPIPHPVDLDAGY